MLDTNYFIKQLEEQIRTNPMDVVAYYNLGNTLQGAGRKDEALVVYRKALELDINKDYSAVVHYNLGTFYYGNKKLDEAILEFEQTIEDLSKLKAKENIKLHVATRAHYGLGCALVDKTQQKKRYGNEENDLRKAEENFMNALKSDPNFSSAQEKLEIVRGMIEHGWSVVEEKTGNLLKFFAGTI